MIAFSEQQAALAASPPAPADASGVVELREAQDRRRAALIERLGTIADLACVKPLEGELGDVAYDLLRQAAAQIASDRQHLAALNRTAGAPPADVIALVLAGRAVIDNDGIADGDAGQNLDKALEAFSSRVCYDDEGGDLPEAHADPCTCGRTVTP